jgi:hypothetical protein
MKKQGGAWKYHSDKGNRHVLLARAAVKRAVADGRLIRPNTCSKCPNSGPIEAHHYRGYEKEFWLVVEWLCVPCHKQADKIIAQS